MRPRSSILTATALVLASAALAVAAVAQPAAGAAGGPRPRVSVPTPVIDLGEISYGEIRDLEFEIDNTGDAPLRIHAARSSCACTVVDFPEEIPPGGKGKITARMEAQLQEGAAAISIGAVTNDPDTTNVLFTIKANVRYYIQALPGFARYLIVQDFEGDSTLRQTMWALDDNPMTITSVETPYDFVTATFRRARAEEEMEDGKGHDQWRVETKISPKAPVGALTGFITVHVDHPKQKVVKLPLHGFVRPIFAVTPPEADWGDLTMGEQGYETSLYVKNFAEENIVVTGAATTVKGVMAEIEEAEPGRVYYVKLSYAPDMPKGPFKGLVKIETDSPKRPVIEVKLAGTIL